MAHDYQHESANAYYVEQLLTITVCGALGGIMALMYFNGMVRYLFGSNEVQYQRVLFGGAALLAVVVVRAGYVWFSTGAQRTTDNHTHAGCHHGGCGDELNPHGQSHAHGHDHGHRPWRFLLLGLPVVLFYLGLPNDGIRGGYDRKLTEEEWKELQAQSVNAKGAGVQQITFKQLEQTARNPDARRELTGQTIRLTGQYVGDDPSQFSLVRYKVGCCPADAIPVPVKIAINPQVRHQFQLDPEPYQHRWVAVTGRLFFVRVNNEFHSQVLLWPDENTPPFKLIEIIPRDPYPYVD
jgi:hypothetical protein